MTSVTYRYKLDPVVLDQLITFADTHRYDEPLIFKEEWDKWVKENTALITREKMRLTELGCTKDVVKKMYKSARYYFKNKTESKDTVERRAYVGTSRAFRDAIDEHITTIARIQRLKPADAFQEFIENKTFSRIINETKADIQGYGFTTEMIDKKIKKTYKNRYFAHQKT